MFYTFGIKKEILDPALFVTCFWLVGRNAIHGLGFVGISNLNVDSVPAYEIMTNLFPIQYWGLLFMLNAALFVIAIVAYGSRDESQYYWMVSAGMLGAIIWSLYTMTSFSAASFYVHSAGYSWVVFAHLVCILMGGSALWQTRKIMKGT